MKKALAYMAQQLGISMAAFSVQLNEKPTEQMDWSYVDLTLDIFKNDIEKLRKIAIYLTPAEQVAQIPVGNQSQVPPWADLYRGSLN